MTIQLPRCLLYLEPSGPRSEFGSGEDIKPVEEHHGKGLQEADSVATSGGVHKGQIMAFNGIRSDTIDTMNRLLRCKSGDRWIQTRRGDLRNSDSVESEPTMPRGTRNSTEKKRSWNRDAREPKEKPRLDSQTGICFPDSRTRTKTLPL